MKDKLQKLLNMTITVALVFQLAGCGTLMYPERRGQVAGRLDVGVVVLDAIGLLFFLIPGVIAFAVDFSNGCIYLPTHPKVITTADLKVIRFDPKHTTLAQIEKIIKDQTGYAVKFSQANLRISRLQSSKDVVVNFAEADTQDNRYAFNFHNSGSLQL